MKKQKIYIIIGIAVVIALIILITQFNVLQTIFSVEPGYIPYQMSDTSFTNANTTTTTCCQGQGFWGGQLYSTNFSSKFWEVYTINSPFSAISSITGSDNQIVVSPNSGCDNTAAGQTVNIIFKDDLKNKNFKVNYDISGNQNKYHPEEKPSFQVLGNEVGSSVQGVIEIVPSLIDENKYTLFINGIPQEKTYPINSQWFITFSVGAPACGNARLVLSNPRWKPQFDCNVSNDEVLIFDEFSEGSVINLTSLSYPIKKFCINQPVIIRSLTNQGIATDTSNELLLNLAQGRNIIVKSGQTVRIPYITKVQSGLFRCLASQAFNTKTQQCENFLSAATEDAEGIYLNNINIGNNEILYTKKYDSSPSIRIGNIVYNTDAPKYTCDCNIEGRILPDKNPSCWKTSLTDVLSIVSKTTYNINNYLSLYYEAQGQGVFNGVKIRNGVEQQFKCTATDDSDWVNIFKLTVDTKGLSISPKDDIKSTVLNKESNLNVYITNNLAKFNTPESGVKIRTISRIVDVTRDEYLTFDLNTGKNSYAIPLKVDFVGDNMMEIIPFVVIEGKTIYGSNSLIINYDTFLKENIANLTDAERLLLLNSYQNNITAQTELISSLQLTLSEQTQLISSLTLSLEEKQQLIDSLEAQDNKKVVFKWIIYGSIIFVILLIIAIIIYKKQ